MNNMDMIATEVKFPDVDEKAASPTTPPAVTAAMPKPAAPVMDVLPPVSDNAVHAAPPEDKPADEPKPKADKKAKKIKAVKPKSPRQPGSGAAIFASVVIVLGLAALAVYAYLKSNNIPVS
jgi:hypothetical protein